MPVQKGLTAIIYRVRGLRYFGLAAVVGLSFSLRFWQLGRFDALVFDEVYYVKFAQAYLQGQAVFDAHPPLGKYLIAVGIWLGERLGNNSNDVTAELGLWPVSYRWMNAFVGALIPLVVVGICQVLRRDLGGRGAIHKSPFSKNRIWLFSLLSGGFVAIDGLFITEARYALINTYIVFFGLLGHWLWLYAANMLTVEQSRRRTMLRLLSGIALGGAIATKWNGLGYVLSLLLWEGWRFIQSTTFAAEKQHFRSIKQAFQQINWRRALTTAGFLILLPAVVYSLIWIPHLSINEDSFLSIHHTLFSFHQGLDEMQVACSRWFTWPLLIKPIAYWYEESAGKAYTVNNLGNPALWWLSSAAIVMLTINTVRFVKATTQKGNGVVAYVLVGYLANWLPWAMVSRCTYNYLYMPSAVFGFVGLAWLLSDWLSVRSPATTRQMGFAFLGAIALSFFFWLPLSLGSPLTPEQLQLRWWLHSWI